MTFTLRDYQHEAKASTYKAWRDDRAVLGVLPTGGGKTVIFADIIKDSLPGRAMVLAHRQELVYQAKEKIEQVAGCHVAIEMGDIRTDENQKEFSSNGRADVVISSIQTHTVGGDGGGRMGKFDPMDFSLLIVDEAHHSTSPSYVKCINYYLTNPKLKVLGVTATPDRADEEALGKIYGGVAFDYEILDLIDRGWLVPVDGEAVEIEDLNFSHIRTQAGDLNLSELSAVMESEKPLHGIADETIKRANGRRGLGFCASVEQARMMANIFNRPGNISRLNGPAAWVCGKTDKLERQQIVKQFSEGKIQWLWNCGVYLEGFDDAGIEVIAMARPTKSRALYTQMAGRGTRTHFSISHLLNTMKVSAMRREMIKRSVKPSIHIIDYVGNSGRHLLMSSVDILSGNYSEDVIEETKLRMRKDGKKMRVSMTIEEEEKRIEEKKKRESEELARKANLVGNSTAKSHRFDPFDIYGIKPVKPRGWDSEKTFSEKQRKILVRAGVDPDQIDYSKGKQLIGIQMERWDKHLCTLKQASLLKKHGCDTSVTFENASKMIDQIAKNHWSKPKEFIGLTSNVPPPVAKTNGDSVDTTIDQDVPF